jgi:molecular chaperone DnaK
LTQAYLPTYDINLPFITADHNGPKHLDLTLSRAQFNNLTADLVEATAGPVRRAMEDAGLQSEQVDQVILVGGSTRIPAVQEQVKEITGMYRLNVIGDDAVAIGAAIAAGVLAGEVKNLVIRGVP